MKEKKRIGFQGTEGIGVSSGVHLGEAARLKGNLKSDLGNDVLMSMASLPKSRDSFADPNIHAHVGRKDTPVLITPDGPRQIENIFTKSASAKSPSERADLWSETKIELPGGKAAYLDEIMLNPGKMLDFVDRAIPVHAAVYKRAHIPQKTLEKMEEDLRKTRNRIRKGLEGEDALEAVADELDPKVLVFEREKAKKDRDAAERDAFALITTAAEMARVKGRKKKKPTSTDLWVAS